MLTDDFTAYAAQIELELPEPVAASAVQKKLTAFLSLIASECSDNGAYLIGHIKCMVESDHGFYASSITAPTDAPSVRGEMTDGSTKLSIVVNVLLYGLDKVTVKQITKAAVPVALAPVTAAIKIWDLESEENQPIHFG
ncbi:hypothetical protein [Candidatus Methanomassiliicoccus intestinalis]|uniref:hypothetical protein n=1 Tax=Candidatus Methanomassiliicoccus intestinalis TaxID=1406512 RepID=UPI0037DCFD1A